MNQYDIYIYATKCYITETLIPFLPYRYINYH